MASNSKTRKAAPAPVKQLEYEVMTDDDLLRELCRLYDNLLGRLSNYHDVGTGVTHEFDGVAIPEALEAGLALWGKADAIQTDFAYGTLGNKPTLTGWYWGLTRFETELKDAAAAAVLGGDDD